MGMPAQQTEWTAEMVRALPDDGKRYELVDGELLVSPAPSLAHQEVLQRLFLLIQPYVERHAIGWTYLSPADIEFSPKRVVQPDLFVVPDTHQGRPRIWMEVKSLLLTVEVLSPSTAIADRLKKRPMYQKEGVKEYWIVDADSRLVERWRPAEDRPEVIAEVLEWQPKPEIPRLRILLDEVFGTAED